jgi:hypothetical protein
VIVREARSTFCRDRGRCDPRIPAYAPGQLRASARRFLVRAAFLAAALRLEADRLRAEVFA